MKIEINKPCHENWDAMTPNEKGAFCMVCQKDVIDFSKQTLDEIRNFFASLPKTNKVCGRFKKSQLKQLSFEHFFNQFIGWKLMHKAALIVYLIVGLNFLAQAQTHPRQKPLLMKGEVAYVPQDTIKKKTVKDSIIPDHHIMGGPRYIPDSQPEVPPKNKPIKKSPAVNRKNESTK